LNCRINIALLAFVWVSTCSGFPQILKINMNLDFNSTRIPIGEPVHIAYLSASVGDSILQRNSHVDITNQVGIPNLRPAFWLENGWVLHKKFIGGHGPLVFKDKAEFLRFINWDYYLFGGPVFYPHPPMIGYTLFSLKPLAVEILQKAHDWEEIHSLLPDRKLFQAEDGSIMELARPHYNCGAWFSSYQEYELRVKLTSD
jgi:hypothetical protein